MKDKLDHTIQALADVAGVPAHSAARVPRAKRLLALEGPLVSGTMAAFNAAGVLGAELTRAGFSDAAQRRVVTRMPFTSGRTPERKARRAMLRSVAWGATAGRDGGPLSLACGGGDSGPMVETYAGYCDAECRATCSARLASRSMRNLVDESPWRRLYRSALWVRGAGLGLVGRDVLRAVIAASAPAPGVPVPLGAAGITRFLGYRVSVDRVAECLATLERLGVLERERRPGHSLVLLLEHDVAWIADLEARLGVGGVGRRALDASDLAVDVPDRFRTVLDSSLWVPGLRGGLGLLARDVYAHLAAASPRVQTRPVDARTRVLAGKLGGLHGERAVRDAVAGLVAAGLAERRGPGRVALVAVKPERLARLEAERGTAAAVAGNERAILADRERQHAYLATLAAREAVAA